MVVLVAGMLGGCAMTPKDLQSEGTRFEYTSKLPPKAAAHCMGRNSEEYKPGLGSAGFPANVREGLTPGAWELVVPHAPSGGALAFAAITPAGSGSKITVWQYPHILFASEQLADVLAKGC